MTSKDFYTIGQVVDKLKVDYHDISISKIRFLEDEGLIKPERTPSGYRKFRETDIERLSSILKLQKEQYLPLSVIKHNQHLLGGKGAGKVFNKVGDGFSDREIKTITTKNALKKLKITKKQFDDYKKYQLVAEIEDDKGNKAISELDFNILNILRSLSKFGIEPRHLRMINNTANNEASLIYQACSSSRKNKKRFDDKINDLANNFASLKKLLLEKALVDTIEG